MVIQRNATNRANVLVAGLAPASATLVEARMVPLTLGQGSATAWTSLPFLSNSKAFRGWISTTGGWYRLDVRAKVTTTVLDQTSVNRVGVGEVFVVAGQSNVAGGFQTVVGATDDRVSCVDFRQDSLSEQLLPLRFNRVSSGTNIGPGQPYHLWGMLGDSLTRRLNVPVLFLGAALGGTSSDQWQQSAAGNFSSSLNASVYRRLGVALLHYVRRTGARAVLWHQGESDLYTSQQTYYDNIRYVIEKSRQQVNNAPLPWVVSRVSFINGNTNPAVIAAQNQLISNLPATFPGPATDSIVGPTNRPDGIHFSGAGLVRFVNSWVQALDANFFTVSTPYTPADESALLTSGYTLPIRRKPGETLFFSSLRSSPVETNNQYKVQILRADDGTTVLESAASSANPIQLTLPGNFPDGEYRFRTLTTNPATTGALSEPFRVDYFAPTTGVPLILQTAVQGGTADAVIRRVGYRYERGSHGFFAMVDASQPVEVRMQRIDGGSFSDSNWYLMPPVSQAPNYPQFADFSYVRFYPPIASGVGGVEPGRYRLSVRRQGDTGAGLWFEQSLLNNTRYILYYTQESVSNVPPVLTTSQATPAPVCLSGQIPVYVSVEGGSMSAGNVYSVRLSDGSGSFTSETVIGTGTSSPVVVTLPASLSVASNYRIRVVASNPAVSSAPSDPLTFCADLSLGMQLGSRTPKVGQPVTVTLTVSNSGPLPAHNIRAMSLLPDNLIFVNALTSSVSAAAGTVIVGVDSVAAGGSVAVLYRLQANQAGTFLTTAQLTATDQADPDSQPNSGTGDGQDDMAVADLRTLDGSGPIRVSPNPNQTPLPALQANQPATDPAKADLALRLTSSSLTPNSGQPFMLSVIVTNRGGATATGVSMQLVLPTGWSLAVTDGLSVNGQIITGNIANIPVDASNTLAVHLIALQAGTLRAQVQTASPSDPDSTPGNGFTNGEDDTASLTLRVR